MKRLLHFIKTFGRLKNYLRERARYVTFGKLVNVMKVEWALLRRKEMVRGYPYEIIVDLTNICQLKCPLCATGAGLSAKKKGYMQFETFRKIIDELGPYALHIYLHNWGESLFHKEIIRFIQYAKTYKVAISVSTNLSFPLTREEADAFITSGLDTMVLSIDGASKETYMRYRVGGNFDLALHNAKLLVETKKKLRNKKPFLEWQFLKMKHNIHEIDKAKAMAQEIGVDSISFGTVVLPFGVNDGNLAEKWLPADELKKRMRYDIQDGDIGKRCWWLWRAVIFNWDGTVSPCCYVEGEMAVFGNILDTDFKNIWNNKDYISARSLFANKKPEKNVICRECGVFLTRR
ncbi:MAG: SPASM domain-containing protein [Deltaproteobacteria bacterium]|nr:SPASM domain-containing protein [Deltaproteobacteria bacterium]